MYITIRTTPSTKRHVSTLLPLLLKHNARVTLQEVKKKLKERLLRLLRADGSPHVAQELALARGGAQVKIHERLGLDLDPALLLVQAHQQVETGKATHRLALPREDIAFHRPMGETALVCLYQDTVAPRCQVRCLGMLGVNVSM